MKFISSLFLLVAPVFASASDERDLQSIQQNWAVTVTNVAERALTFNTGAGGGTNPNIKIGVSDLCRTQANAAGRASVGQFYPTSNVVGIDVAGGGVTAPGSDGASFSFAFVEGINGNTAIYEQDFVGNTAKVEFCVEIGLYEDATLINFAEVQMTYNVNLVTNILSLDGYTVTQAEDFNGDNGVAVAFDGTLEAYFCNPTTYAMLTTSVGGETHQGSILSVCVKVPDGQFEIADIIELNIVDGTDTTISQSIITASAPAQSGLYATKACTDASNADTNICVVQFLLKANFYDFTALTLTGNGSVLLEFGDASGSRRQLRRELQVESGQEKEYQVTAQEFVVTDVEGSSANTAMTSLAAIGAIAAMVL